MTTTLSVPVTFDLPPEWEPRAPRPGAAPGVDLVALHRDGPGSAAAITVGGEFRPEAITLAGIADEGLESLRPTATALQVDGRREVGSADAPGLVQRVTVTTPTATLVQYQTYLALLDRTDSRKRVVVKLVLTAAPEQVDAALGDYQRLVASVRPR